MFDSRHLMVAREMERDREATQTKLMDAVERIAIRDGFESCGVNAIAHEAGVDKVLIYRYFGGVAGLVSTVIAQRAAWPNTPGVSFGDGVSPGSSFSTALITQARDIRARPLAQHAIAWEASGHADHEVARPVTERRETQFAALASALHERAPSRLDVDAVGALVAAGLTILAARTDGVPFFGLDVQKDADWRRIEKAAGTILRALLDPSDA